MIKKFRKKPIMVEAIEVGGLWAGKEWKLLLCEGCYKEFKKEIGHPSMFEIEKKIDNKLKATNKEAGQ